MTVASQNAAVRQAKQKVVRAERTAERVSTNPWMTRLARAGYATRGLLYVVVGVLALQVAIGRGGQTTNTKGAIGVLAEQPFGRALLIVVAAGLAAYSLWGLVRASIRPQRGKPTYEGLALRGSYLMSGLWYGSLVPVAVNLLVGTSRSEGKSTQDMMAATLTYPFGHWLVFLFGFFFLAFGLSQLYEAYAARFKKDFATAEMTHAELTWAIRLGRLGMAARGVAYSIVGVFAFIAGAHHDPGQAKGVEGALQFLQQQAYGPLLLGATALGFIAFGCYSLICARWARIQEM